MSFAVLACAPCFFAVAQPTRNESVIVDDARPVAAAVLELMTRYGQVVTYEDPRYLYAGDVKDVALEVRKDIDRFPRGPVPPVLVPVGGHIDFRFTVSDRTGEPDDWGALLTSLVDQSAAGGTGARFRIERSGDAYHVIPAQIRNPSGQWVTTASILDAYITIPEQMLTKAEIIGAICAAVSEAMNVRLLDVSRIGIGAQPASGPPRERFVVDNEKARDVLLRELESYQAGLAWQIFQEPGTSDYYLGATWSALFEPPSVSNPPPLPRPPAPRSGPMPVCNPAMIRCR